MLWAIELICIRIWSWVEMRRFRRRLSKRSLIFLFFGGSPALICTRSACTTFSSSISFFRNTQSVGWAHWKTEFIRRWYASALLLVRIDECVVRWCIIQKSMLNIDFRRTRFDRSFPRIRIDAQFFWTTSKWNTYISILKIIKDIVVALAYFLAEQFKAIHYRVWMEKC